MEFTFQIIDGSEYEKYCLQLTRHHTMDPRSSQDDLISSNNESQTLDSNPKQTMERFNILQLAVDIFNIKYKIFPLFVIEGSLSSFIMHSTNRRV